MKISKRLGAALCVTALLMTAACSSQGGEASSEGSGLFGSDTAVSDTQNSAENSPSESSSESSAESPAESSQESSTDTMAGWSFREVAEPSMPTEAFTKRTDSELYKDDFKTAAPYEAFDFEKTKELLKADTRFAGMQFVDAESENLKYNESKTGTDQIQPIKNVWFSVFSSDLEKIKRGFSFVNTYDSYTTDLAVSIHTMQTYSLNDKPELYELTIRDRSFTQDDIFELAKSVFGESIAEYLVYQPSKNGTSATFDNMSKEIGNYKLERDATNDEYTYSVTLSVHYRWKYDEVFYSNGYKPMTMDIPISEMLETDLGNTDYSKPETFLDKALSYGGSADPYKSTNVERSSLTAINFSDGSKGMFFEVSGRRISGDTSVSIYDGGAQGNMTEQLNNGDRMFNINGFFTRNPDKSITVHGFSLTLPTTFVSTEHSGMDKVIENFELAKKQADAMYKLTADDHSRHTDKTEEEPEDYLVRERDYYYWIKDLTLKVCGQDYPVSITIHSNGKTYSNENRSEYFAYLSLN